MVSVSRETIAETNLRLAAVMAEAELKLYASPYVFREYAIDELPGPSEESMLALVRDDTSFCQLVEYDDQRDACTKERFAIWRFHFKQDDDNSGFVGWLATLLKAEFGTGVFVICGHNRDAGGIYDYWACPEALRKDVFSKLLQLTGQ